MKRKTYTDEQIIGILKEHEAGLPANEVIRKRGISPAAFYRWKSKFDGMDLAEAKWLQELEAENAKLQRLLRIPYLRSPLWNRLFVESGNADSTTLRCRLSPIGTRAQPPQNTRLSSSNRRIAYT